MEGWNEYKGLQRGRRIRKEKEEKFIRFQEKSLKNIECIVRLINYI